MNATPGTGWTSSGAYDALVINLTPPLARLLLNRVGENRKPAIATINRYASIMRAKQWKLTHQGIGISTRFEVIDGQHRIRAVIESGATIEVLVVRGVSQDAILFLDNGKVRTDHEALGLADFSLRDLDKVEVTSAKRMMRGARRSMRPVSREDLRLFVTRHREPIRKTCAALWKDGRVPNVTHSELVAVLARASYHASADDLMAATVFLASGKGDGDRYEPLLALREWLLKATTREQLAQRYGKTERALDAFFRHEKIGRRLAESREELFRLPEERDDDEA